MLPYFSELGRAVGERWKQQNFSPRAFPEIACALLDEQPPAASVEVGELMREFLMADQQPFQTSSGFGQPELVVYDDPRFYIQVLFWLEGTTDIHQHTFSGAFHVLAGSSIHSHFEFKNAETVSAHLRVGDIVMKDTRLLETGSTVPILSGPGFIHSLFHLDSPSLTVVVRTHEDPGTQPQFSYLPPHIALDPFHADALTNRRKQLLDVMEKMGDPDYASTLIELLERLDFERGFFVLQNGLGYLKELGQWEEVLTVFETKHGKLASGVAATLEEIVRRDSLVQLRASLTDPEHRFFLALLLNVPTRADILALVQQRFPGEPSEHVLRWAEELTSETDQGTWMLDAQFPDEVESENPPLAFLTALQRVLKPKEKRAKSVASNGARDFKVICEALEASSFRALLR